jgi:uncharacterized protein DUF1524
MVTPSSACRPAAGALKLSVPGPARPQNPKPGDPPAPPNVGRIGNLILVPESLNNEVLANKPFLKKLSAFKQAHLPLDPTLAGAVGWTSAEIDKRTQALALLLQTKVFRV